MSFVFLFLHRVLFPHARLISPLLFSSLLFSSLRSSFLLFSSLHFPFCVCGLAPCSSFFAASSVSPFFSLSQLSLVFHSFSNHFAFCLFLFRSVRPRAKRAGHNQKGNHHRPSLKNHEYIKKLKDRMRARGNEHVPRDSKYSGRKRSGFHP